MNLAAWAERNGVARMSAYPLVPGGTVGCPGGNEWVGSFR